MGNMENIIYWFDHASKKTRPDSKPGGNRAYRAYLAKNEYETVQFVLLSETKADGLTLEISSFADKAGNTMEMEADILKLYYIETRDGEFYPDPAAPLTGGFSLEANKNQPFLIKIKSTKETPAGEYSASLTLKSNGGVLLSAEVSAKVWDFALPDKPSCATYVEIRKGSIDKMHGTVPNTHSEELYQKYYDFLLDHKISAHMLPYNISSPLADSYLNDPRVTCFRVNHGDSEDDIRGYRKKLGSNPDWAKKAVFYPFDEPVDSGHYDRIAEEYKRLDALYPGCRILTPFFRNIKLDGDTDNIDAMTGIIQVWCPKTYMFDNKNIYDNDKKISDPPFAERMAGLKAAGNDIWWYVCWEPGLPFCNLYVDMPGILHRMMFWQQKLYGVDGFLYWCVNYWDQVDDPWGDMRTVKDLSCDVFGDGSLLYNGNKIGIDGPVGSLRLENIRKGIDDFEYLCLAEQIFGGDYVDACIKKITASLTEYSSDDDKLMDTRMELGNAIENALS